ncbi:IPT/TIG domain-containing protein [Nocardia sp. 004]|uniref:IPT/TIG domain-containing protein n=1 Tax=Nocardia sp. 004 TaxID=3385978 RepID=UPI00399F59EF
MPTITAIFPTFGPPSGGNFVVITGIGFVGPTSVYFGGTATTFVQDNPAQITALAPPGSGTVLVTVINSGGVSNGVPYTYGAPAIPTLTAIAPTAGLTTGGNIVVLTGTNLTGATAVTFGGTPAVSFTVDSATQITAIAPAGAVGPVGVTVSTPGGTSTPIIYAYVSVPTLLSVSPTTGSNIGGTVVTLTGTGFTGATAVTFGVTPAAGFTVDSDTQITATAPPGALGLVGVTVTTPGGTSNPVLFTYAQDPAVTVVGPNTGPAAGGTAVLISGSGFTGTTSVTFGGVPAAFVVNSDNSISAVTPANPIGQASVGVTTALGASFLLNGFTYV